MAEPQQGAGAKRGAGQTAGARLAAKRAAKAARKAAKRGTDEDVVTNELVESVEHANSWIDEHQKVVWGAVAVIGVVGTLVLTLSLHTEKVGGEAAAQLFEGVEVSLAPVQSDDAEAPEGVTTYTSVASRATAALAPFRKTQKDFPGTEAAQWARLGEATALREQGELDAALTAYDEVAKQASGELQYFAYEGAGFVLEEQGKPAEALARFEQVAELSGGVYKPEADYHVARMLVAQGKKDEAIKRLEGLIEAEVARSGGPDELDYGTIRERAETLLVELGVAPKTPPAGAGGGAGDPAALQKLLEQLNLKGQVLQPGAEGQ